MAVTWRSWAASAHAMLVDTDVLPSPGSHEVTAIIADAPAGRLMSRLLRSSWKASMAIGSLCFTNRSVGRSPGTETRGISPSTVAPMRSFTSVNRLSRRRTPAAHMAAKMPRMTPNAAAPKMMGARGFDGAVGIWAGDSWLSSYPDSAGFGWTAMSWFATASAYFAAATGSALVAVIVTMNVPGSTVAFTVAP